MTAVAFPADTWGLSWSKRWHIIDRDKATSRGGDPVSLCGAWLYSQTKVLEKSVPRHLLAIIDDPSKAAK